MFILK